MKKIKFTAAESRVLSCLQVGKDNAVSRNSLLLQIGLTDRWVRQMIHNLRKKNIEIISSSSKDSRGYWLASSYDDRRKFTNMMDHYGKSSLSVSKGIRKSLKSGRNQLSMFDG